MKKAWRKEEARRGERLSLVDRTDGVIWHLEVRGIMSARNKSVRKRMTEESK
jgi:hypothetical protein